MSGERQNQYEGQREGEERLTKTKFLLMLPEYY